MASLSPKSKSQQPTLQRRSGRVWKQGQKIIEVQQSLGVTPGAPKNPSCTASRIQPLSAVQAPRSTAIRRIAAQMKQDAGNAQLQATESGSASHRIRGAHHVTGRTAPVIGTAQCRKRNSVSNRPHTIHRTSVCGKGTLRCLEP